MKPKFYTLLCALWLIGFSFSSQSAAAQCSCSSGGGIVQYTVSRDSLTSFTNIPIPQFDISIGELRCVTIKSNITSVMSFYVINKVDVEFEYNMKSNLTVSLSGPGGLNNSLNHNEDYGPYLLGPEGSPTDSVFVGPDSIFVDQYGESTRSANLNAYIGTGNVNIAYDFSGPVWPSPSSGNYLARVISYSNVDFTVEYAWCPHSVLSSGISKFSAYKTASSTQFEWIGYNQEYGTSYQIEMSPDGKNYSAVKSVKAGESKTEEFSLAIGSPANTAVGFFRIKRINKDGTFSYSEVKRLSYQDQMSMTPYPNPAISGVRLDFDRAIKGDMEVELINTTGQRIFSKQYTLRNQPSLQVDWAVKPVPGLYYVRATDKATRQQYTTRLLIQ